MPQGLTRLGSVTAAAPVRSDTRFVCRTVPEAALGGAAAAAPAPSVIRAPAASSAGTTNSGRGSRRKLDSSWIRFMVHLHGVFLIPDKRAREADGGAAPP